MDGITNKEAVRIIKNVQFKTNKEKWALEQGIKALEAINKISTVFNDWHEGNINELTAYGQFEDILRKGDYL